MLPTGERRCAVLRHDAEHVLHSLREYTQDRSRTPVGADHGISRTETPDRPPPLRSQHATEIRLRASPHERQRRDLDRPALEHLPRAVEVDHIVERIVERTEIRIHLLGEIAGEEPELLAGLDGGTGENDAREALL